MLPLSYHFHFPNYYTNQPLHSFALLSPYPNPFISIPVPISKRTKSPLLHSQTFKTRMATTTANPSSQPDPSNQTTRLQEIKQFDESKIGVKGLVDRGLTAIPSFFIHPNPPDPNPNESPNAKPDPKPTIPIIDFSSPRSTLVDQLRRASSDLGFFQIVNHSVPLSSIKKILNSIRGFFELPEREKMEYYSRDMSRGAAYSTNFDLYQSKAASWRDTFQMGLSPNPPRWENVPVTCREAVAEWDKEVVKISEEIMDILCEGLGLEKKSSSDGNRLKEMSCMDGRVMASHYYPYCPQPELTAGLTSHTDPGVLTVLVQNEVLGLQVKVGEHWVDVEPVEGAIVINIGDIFQILSNDEYKSVEHRVLANPFRDPRVSVAVFLKPGLRDMLCGPFPELVSAEKPAVYRQFTLSDYMKRFFSKELDGKTLTKYYRV